MSRDESIVITKADKGNAVVIQDKENYQMLVKELLEDSTKFKRLSEDVTLKRERALQNSLRELYNKGYIKKEVYQEIIPKGSRAGVMYGLPKIHKNPVKLRPIISACGTYNYKLAKHLDNILKDVCLKDSKYIMKDTFDFINRVSKLKNSNHRMISFDIVSLFTNIPILETIEIILNRVFHKKNKQKYFHGFDRETLKQLLITCTQKSHFQFMGCFYDQVDGVAMGSPLGPLFANIFMDEFEKITWRS